MTSPNAKLVCRACRLFYPLPPGSKNKQYHCRKCRRPLEVHSPQKSSQPPPQRPRQSASQDSTHQGNTTDTGDATIVDPQAQARQEQPGLKRHFSSRVPNQYQATGILGQGGGGKVYEVRDKVLKRPTALKLILPGKSGETLKKRFWREILVTSRLEHPNIMPVYDAGYLRDGTMYFTMKKIGGGTLKDLLKPKEENQYPLPLRELLEIFLKVCDAINYAHSRGVIHRDLKPSNIAVGDFGEVIVMDWGLAKYRGEEEEVEISQGDSLFESDLTEYMGENLSLHGSILGTPAYMPPEQANGRHDLVGPVSDVYSLGAVLYHILTLTPPYQGPPQKIVTSLLMGDPEPPEERSPHLPLPRPLSAIAMHALSRDVEERYPSVREMIEDLQNYLDDRPLSVYTPPLAEKVQKFVRRHSVKLAVALLISLMVAGFGYLLAMEKQRRLKAQKKKLSAEKKINKERMKKIEAQKKQEELYKKTLAAEKDKLAAEKEANEVRRKREEYYKKLIRAYEPYLEARDRMQMDMRFENLRKVVVPKLKEAISIQPRFMEAQWTLLKVYSHLAMEKEVKNQLLSLLQVFAADETGKKFSRLIAVAFFKRDQLKKNPDLLNKMDKYKPGFVPAVYWQILKILFLSYVGEHDRALEELEKLFKERKVISWDLLFLKGEVLLKAKKIEESKKVFSQIIRRYSHIPYPYLSRARLYRGANEYKKALEDYKVVMKLDPTCHVLWKDIGYLQNKYYNEQKAKDKIRAFAHQLARYRYYKKSVDIYGDDLYANRGMEHCLNDWKEEYQVEKKLLEDPLSFLAFVKEKYPLEKHPRLAKEFALLVFFYTQKTKVPTLSKILKKYGRLSIQFLKDYHKNNPHTFDEPLIKEAIFQLNQLASGK